MIRLCDLLRAQNQESILRNTPKREYDATNRTALVAALVAVWTSTYSPMQYRVWQPPCCVRSGQQRFRHSLHLRCFQNVTYEAAHNVASTVWRQWRATRGVCERSPWQLRLREEKGRQHSLPLVEGPCIGRSIVMATAEDLGIVSCLNKQTRSPCNIELRRVHVNRRDTTRTNSAYTSFRDNFRS